MSAGDEVPDFVERADRWVTGGVCALAVVALMALIVVQVTLSALGRGVSIPLGADLPLLGESITVNGMIDAQWHLLLVISLLPLGLLVLRDRHVRVDVFHAVLPPRVRLMIDVVGHLVLALPFLWLIVPAAYDFFQSALRSGEGSALGGLRDVWIIKLVLLMGLVALGFLVLVDLARKIARLARGGG